MNNKNLEDIREETQETFKTKGLEVDWLIPNGRKFEKGLRISFDKRTDLANRNINLDERLQSVIKLMTLENEIIVFENAKFSEPKEGTAPTGIYRYSQIPFHHETDMDNENRTAFLLYVNGFSRSVPTEFAFRNSLIKAYKETDWEEEIENINLREVREKIPFYREFKLKRGITFRNGKLSPAEKGYNDIINKLVKTCRKPYSQIREFTFETLYNIINDETFNGCIPYNDDSVIVRFLFPEMTQIVLDKVPKNRKYSHNWENYTAVSTVTGNTCKVLHGRIRNEDENSYLLEGHFLR